MSYRVQRKLSDDFENTYRCHIRARVNTQRINIAWYRICEYLPSFPCGCVSSQYFVVAKISRRRETALVQIYRGAHIKANSGQAAVVWLLTLSNSFPRREGKSWQDSRSIRAECNSSDECNKRGEEKCHVWKSAARKCVF